MNIRSLHAFAAAALLTGLTAGCASGPSSSPSSSASSTPASSGSGSADARLFVASGLIVQCALTRGLMKPPTDLANAGNPPFVQDTKLVITQGNSNLFNAWYAGVEGTMIAGQKLDIWVLQTATSGKLPSAICGTSVTASDLLNQVFANDQEAIGQW